MIEIIPAIMPKDYDDLFQKMSLVSGKVSLVQIDIMDGFFVANSSWPYTESGGMHHKKIIDEQEGMPFWDKVDFELDLMIERPDRDIDSWVRLGAKRIIIHAESLPDLGNFIFGMDEYTRENVELGVALSIDTPIELLHSIIDSIQFVQCMGIDQIGFQGQPFDERVLQKIKDIRQLFPDIVISVDGGVNIETAPILIEAGVTRLVSGSGIFEGDVEENLAAFQEIIDSFESK